MFLYLFCSHDYELVFGFSMLGLSKGQRLLSGATMMTHAMVFTGINVEVSVGSQTDACIGSLLFHRESMEFSVNAAPIHTVEQIPGEGVK